MLIDLEKSDAPTALDCDLCIAGAGAAGITIALQLAHTSLKVVILEAGGLHLEARTQALYKGESVGLPYFDLSIARLRYFGGSSNHWGGLCSPLTDMDFEERPWVPHSGWPIARQDLNPFYAAAHEILDIGEFQYDPARIAPDKTPYVSFSPEKLAVRLWRISPPTRLGEKYRGDLQRADNLSVILNANVTELVANETASRVDRLRATTLDGKTIEVRAGTVILACGGIETPRLLLCSNAVQKPGLGNQNDLVGRFFMEHPFFGLGIAAIPKNADWFRAYLPFVADGCEIRPALGPSESAQREHEILNCFNKIQPTREPHLSEGYLALKKSIRQILARGRYPDAKGAGATTVLRAAELRHLARLVLSRRREVISGIYGRLIGPPGLHIGISLEQAPNPDSRVSLAEECDALGMPKVKLDWRLTDLERRTARTLHRMISSELDRLSLGQLEMEDWLKEDGRSWPVTLEASHHHIGTTRMADDPKRGVVDRHCRVHGIDNLYIAGCNVFPTSGYANPMLTVVALALRLADHLRRQLLSDP